jgi:pre-mRNA-processing factor 17
MEHHAKLNPEQMGRPFTAPPPDLKNTDHTCYIPKRCIHTFYGHTKGVQVIRFYPRYGHLLLSGSMDNKVSLSFHCRSKCGI